MQKDVSSRSNQRKGRFVIDCKSLKVLLLSVVLICLINPAVSADASLVNAEYHNHYHGTINNYSTGPTVADILFITAFSVSMVAFAPVMISAIASTTAG